MSETLDQFAARIRRLADGELVGTLRPVMVEHALRAEAAAKVTAVLAASLEMRLVAPRVGVLT